MICGYLHPTFERWLKAIDDKEPVVRRTIRAAIGVVAVATMVAWYNMFYTLPKLEYNQIHPYTSWIPISAFLILRNITPTLRLKSLGLYGWMGCITLETYVLSVFIPSRQVIWMFDSRLLTRMHPTPARHPMDPGNFIRGSCPRCPTPSRSTSSPSFQSIRWSTSRS